MSDQPSVLVVGGGTMGLAAAWALARRGHPVTVLERFGHVHDRGSHSGFTRMIRHAYHEGHFYVELVSRADALWTELGERVGQTLLVRAGLYELGAPGEAAFEAACASLRDHAIPHDVMDAEEANRRFPLFHAPQGWTATFSPDSGYLRVGPCLDALRAEAEAAGALVRHGVRVREVIRGGDRVRALLEEGTLEVADRIVVCAGAFTSELLPGLRTRSGRRLVTPVRRVLAWTRPALADRATFAAAPAWAVYEPEGMFYGFPLVDEGLEGFKLARHVVADPADPVRGVDPDRVDRSVGDEELEPLRRFLERRLTCGAGPITDARTCLYGNSEGGDFILDTLGDDPRVVLAAGFSGHGFKFAPVIGEQIASLVAGEPQRIEAFRL